MFMIGIVRWVGVSSGFVANRIHEPYAGRRIHLGKDGKVLWRAGARSASERRPCASSPRQADLQAIGLTVTAVIRLQRGSVMQTGCTSRSQPLPAICL